MKIMILFPVLLTLSGRRPGIIKLYEYHQWKIIYIGSNSAEICPSLRGGGGLIDHIGSVVSEILRFTHTHTHTNRHSVTFICKDVVITVKCEAFLFRKGGDIGLFITLVPKVL